MDSSVANARARIVRMVAEEFPGCAVAFDEGVMIRFRIDLPDGKPLSRACPHFESTEVEDWSEEKLRQVVLLLGGASK